MLLSADFIFSCPIFSGNSFLLFESGAQGWKIGITEAFRRLAARTYEHYIEINFIKTPKAVGIFNGAQNASDILEQGDSTEQYPERRRRIHP